MNAADDLFIRLDAVLEKRRIAAVCVGDIYRMAGIGTVRTLLRTLGRDLFIHRIEQVFLTLRTEANVSYEADKQERWLLVGDMAIWNGMFRATVELYDVVLDAIADYHNEQRIATEKGQK